MQQYDVFFLIAIYEVILWLKVEIFFFKIVTLRKSTATSVRTRVTSRYDFTQTANNFWFCTNIPSRYMVVVINTNWDGFMLHQWPKDPKFARNWSRFARNTRMWIGPTQYSLLCSEHFPENCYETTEMARSCGYPPRLREDSIARNGKTISTQLPAHVLSLAVAIVWQLPQEHLKIMINNYQHKFLQVKGTTIYF